MFLIVVIALLQLYCLLLMAFMAIYTVRHFLFTHNRALHDQRISYEDIIDSDLPFVTVMIPMHNEEAVAGNILELLGSEDFDKMQVEILAINDHSSDRTAAVIQNLAAKYPCITPLHRSSGLRGKPAALNEALKIAKGSVVIVFDADYLPPKGMIRNLALAFKDPEVAAVMGRVIPINESKNLLTKLISLERIGGYQVDQQARYNLHLLPQYGGTVGGFRKDVINQLGGFDPRVLAEDTDFTFKSYSHGWQVIYANRAECYEEAPEEWATRARQIQRWSRGHNQVMLTQWHRLLKSPYISLWPKIDAFLLLCIYMVPPLLIGGIIVSLLLLFLGQTPIFLLTQYAIFIMAYYGFGNFAPFHQIGVAALLDGDRYKIRLLPLMAFKFLFSAFYSTRGMLQAIVDRTKERAPEWIKTKRSPPKTFGPNRPIKDT